MADTALRAELLERFPFLGAADRGPNAVEAGECDECGAEPRLVAACGPGAPPYLGRVCALARGEGAWCDGHAEDAEGHLMWLAELPDGADVATRLWWVATGEVRLDPDLVAGLRRRLGIGG